MKQHAKSSPPVKYVLYSHYAAGESKDLKTYTNQDKLYDFRSNREAERTCLYALDGVRNLEQHFRGLRELLTAPGHEGLLVLFYAPGFEEFLEGVANHENEDQLLERSPAGFTQFFQDDIKDLSLLAKKLTDPSLPVSKFLLERFPLAIQERLREPIEKDPDLLHEVVNVLNKIVQRPISIHEERLFHGVNLRHETKALLNQHPGQEGCMRLNRLLVEDAFPETLARNSPPLRFARAFAECVQQKLQDAKLEGRVRFVTSLDLLVILGRVNTIFAGKFRKHIVGPAHGIRYDTPKIPEAILRLRFLGHGVPVLRIDHDVIFRGKNNKDAGDLGLFKAVACAKLAYHLRVAEPSVSTFLFSASYNTRALADPKSYPDRFEAWSRAFATRVHPALVADVDEIKRIALLPEANQNNEWDSYVQSRLDEALVRRYYGLKESGVEPEGAEGLAAVGAHASFAVISGALLCLSEGAILDLPPFSNFRNNVMWIDDHLKYSLHREMRHFTSGEELNLGDLALSQARLDEVMVTKARPGVSNLVGYTLGVYLPTLFLGTIVDAWITPASILKCRFSELYGRKKQEWLAARKSEQAELPKAMMETLRVGHFSDDARNALEAALTERAVRRIEEVRQSWTSLKRDSLRTFASYWAAGEVRGTFPSSCFNGDQYKDNMWMGILISPERPLNEPVTSLTELNAPMAMKVQQLIQDALNYVQWTLDWPQFVQVVRSIEQGSFLGDMNSFALKRTVKYRKRRNGR